MSTPETNDLLNLTMSTLQTNNSFNTTASTPETNKPHSDTILIVLGAMALVIWVSIACIELVKEKRIKAIRRQNGDEERGDSDNYCDCDRARGKRLRKIEVTVEATQKLVEQALQVINGNIAAVDPPPDYEERKDA